MERRNEMSLDNKTFAAFVKQAASYNMRQASSVALYIEKRTDSKGEIGKRIKAAFEAGKIDAGYKQILADYLEACFKAWLKSGKMIDQHDPSDWQVLPGGGHMRKTHLDSDQNNYGGGFVPRMNEIDKAARGE